MLHKVVSILYPISYAVHQDESEEEDDDAFYLAPEVARKIPIELLLKLITSLAPKLNEFVYANKSYTEQEVCHTGSLRNE